MKIGSKELLEQLKGAYEIEEVMAGLLTHLAKPHVLASKVPAQDRQKIRRMLSVVHSDTLRHKKIVAGMIRYLSGGSFGV